MRIRLRGEAETAGATEGCSLAPRCHHAADECFVRPQRLEQIAPTRFIACHRASEGQITLPSQLEPRLVAQTGEDR